MSGTELERFAEPAPQVWRGEPPLGELDADGSVAIVLDACEERRNAGGQPDEQGDQREPALLHCALPIRQERSRKHGGAKVARLELRSYARDVPAGSRCFHEEDRVSARMHVQFSGIAPPGS